MKMALQPIKKKTSPISKKNFKSEMRLSQIIIIDVVCILVEMFKTQRAADGSTLLGPYLAIKTSIGVIPLSFPISSTVEDAWAGI